MAWGRRRPAKSRIEKLASQWPGECANLSAWHSDPSRTPSTGYKRAAVAIAHKILVAIYHMFSHRVCYHELGDLYLNRLNKDHLARNLVHRLERLGYTVTLEHKAT